MTEARFLFELAGDHATLPFAELTACQIAEAPDGATGRLGSCCAIVTCEPSDFHRIADRLGLSQKAGPYIGSCDPDGLDDVIASTGIPEGSFAVRCRRVEGSRLVRDPMGLARRIGAALDRPIDLTSPEHTLRALISDRIHLFIQEWEVDRGSFDSRKVENRPHFSPISLHPRYARAAVNLTGVKRGETLLDPFCGTGGILMEASLVGARALGSDIDPAMVEGAKRNLETFDIPFEAIEVCDVDGIDSVFGVMDAIATDPPYGRSTSTVREGLDSLYARMMVAVARTLDPKGRSCIVLPRDCAEVGTTLSLVEEHRQRVHGSLERHYCIMTR